MTDSLCDSLAIKFKNNINKHFEYDEKICCTRYREIANLNNNIKKNLLLWLGLGGIKYNYIVSKFM